MREYMSKPVLNEVTQVRTAYEPPPANEQNKGKLLVWNTINPPSKMAYYEVASVEEAKKVIDYLANEQLKDPRISCNAFGLMLCAVGDEGWEWVEWEDGETGDDIETIMQNQE